jgi:hypothetical protein
VTARGRALRRLRRIPGKIREAGPVFTIYRSLQLLAPRVVRVDWFTIFERPLRAVAARDDQAGIRWAGSDDVGLLASLGLAPSAIEARLSRGDRACILVQGDELVACAWFSFGAYEEAGLRFPLGPGEVWGHDATVALGERGRGHYPRLLRSALADLAEEGVTRSLSAIDELNRNARRAIERSGARPLCGLLVIRLASSLAIVRAQRAGDVRWRLFTRHLEVASELYRPGPAEGSA